MKWQLHPVLPRRGAAMEGTSAAEAARTLPLYRSGETAAPPKGKKMFAVSQIETGG